MHNEYRNPVMRHLRDQLTRYAPRQKKVEQIGVHLNETEIAEKLNSGVSWNTKPDWNRPTETTS